MNILQSENEWDLRDETLPVKCVIEWSGIVLSMSAEARCLSHCAKFPLSLSRQYHYRNFKDNIPSSCPGGHVNSERKGTLYVLGTGIPGICRWDVNQGLRDAKGIYFVGDLIPNITVETLTPLVTHSANAVIA